MINCFKVSRFFLYLIPLGIVIVTTSTLFPFIVGKYVWFRTLVDLALIFFLLGLLFQDKLSEMSRRLLSVFKKPLVIAVSVFVFIFVLACFFGVDPKFSFWSNFERGEGGLQMIHLWLFFILLILLFKDEKDWQRLFIIAIIGGLGMALYGVAASLKYVDAEIIIRDGPGGIKEQLLTGKGGPLYQAFRGFVGPPFSGPSYRFQGSIGNPAYVATYAIFMMFYVAYLLVSKYKNRLFSFGASALWFLMVVFVAVFFAAATRGAFLGLIASVFVFVGYLAFSSRRWRKWLVVGGLGLVILVMLLIQFKNTPLVKSLPGSRIFDISISAETFQTRWVMWGIAFSGFKERPILGWGPENFLNVFDGYFDPRYSIAAKGGFEWFDRAHSIYFDYLAETGILGFLSFLGIFAVFYWQFFSKTRINAEQKFLEADKRGNKQKSIVNSQRSIVSNALLFALPVAYLVQGIVLFDVLPIYINIFLFLAFVSYKFNKQQYE